MSADRGDTTRRTLCVVSPCFNEAAGIRQFHAALEGVLASLGDLDHRLVLVDDGSTDATLQVLNELAGADERVRVYSLSRNFGHQLALTAGSDVARGDAVLLEAITGETEPPATGLPRRSWLARHRVAVAAAGTAVAMVATLVIWRPWRTVGTPAGSGPERIPSILALPCKVYGAPEVAFLTDAVPGTISTLLAQVEGLDTKVPPTSFEVEKVKGDFGRLAELYEVSSFIVTSINTAAGGFALNVQLVDAKPRSRPILRDEEVEARGLPGRKRCDEEGESHRYVVGRSDPYSVGAVEAASEQVVEDVSEREARLVHLVTFTRRQRARRGGVLVEEGIRRLIDLGVEEGQEAEPRDRGGSLVRDVVPQPQGGICVQQRAGEGEPQARGHGIHGELGGRAGRRTVQILAGNGDEGAELFHGAAAPDEEARRTARRPHVAAVRAERRRDDGKGRGGERSQ